MGIGEKPGSRAQAAWGKGLLAFALAGLMLMPAPHVSAQGSVPAPTYLRKVLVLDKSQGGASGSLEARRNLRAALAELSATYGFEVAIVDQNASAGTVQSAFSSASLAGYQAVIFDFNDGVDKQLDSASKSNVENYVKNGGGLIAIHSASAFISNWPFLVEALVECFYGPWGSNHPTANLYHDSEGLAEGAETRGILRGLTAPKSFLDMFISFRHSPRGQPGVTILATVDERSFSTTVEGPMGDDHPVVWTKTVGKGKVIHHSLGFSWSQVNAFEQSDGYLKKLLYNLLRYSAGDFIGCTDTNYVEYNRDATKTDIAACKTILASPIRSAGPSTSRSSSPVINSLPGAGTVMVRFPSEGKHALVLMDIKGNRFQQRTGIGPAEYALRLPERKGLFLVETTAGGRTRTQRIMIP